MDETSRLSGIPIVIDTEPKVFWDIDAPERQRDFLSSIDTSFFSYQAESHSAHLSGEHGAHAAVAIRVAYSHALESLFALVGAAIQAPKCPAGWLLQYQNVKLTSLMRKISEGTTIESKLEVQGGGWAAVVKALFPFEVPQNELDDSLEASAIALETLANDFLDPVFQDEYNSLKHGLRVRSGGTSLALGAEDTPGTPAPPERMRLLFQSQYGSTFIRARNLKKYQWTFDRQSINWNPENLAKRITLIVQCMENVLTSLKLINGVPAEECLFCPLNRSWIDDVLMFPSSDSRINMSLNITAGHVQDLTKAQILEKYRF